MKKFFLFVFLMTSVFSFSQNLSEFRALMQKGESSETVAKSLLEKSKTTKKSVSIEEFTELIQNQTKK